MPIASKNVKIIIQISEFGNPKSELCGAFKTVLQLNMLLRLHANIASLFSSRISFSIVCIKAAMSPILAPIVNIR